MEGVIQSIWEQAQLGRMQDQDPPPHTCTSYQNFKNKIAPCTSTLKARNKCSQLFLQTQVRRNSWLHARTCSHDFISTWGMQESSPQLNLCTTQTQPVNYHPSFINSQGHWHQQFYCQCLLVFLASTSKVASQQLGIATYKSAFLQVWHPVIHWINRTVSHFCWHDTGLLPC